MEIRINTWSQVKRMSKDHSVIAHMLVQAANSHGDSIANGDDFFIMSLLRPCQITSIYKNYSIKHEIAVIFAHTATHTEMKRKVKR